METNICKFNFNASSDLTCTCFVREGTDAQSEPRRCNDHALHLVLGGSGRLTVNGRQYPLGRGDLFFTLQGDTAAIERGDMEYAYIRFRGRRSTEIAERLGVGDGHCVFPGHEALIPFWSDCLSRATDDNLDLLSEAVLLYSLAELSPRKKEVSDVIARVVRITGESFSDPALALSTVAAEVGYHDKYISALFKRQKGITYTQYLRELRIRHAVFLIEQGVVSVKNVAILSGFGDALYFSRVFKEMKGISPKEMIRRVTEACDAEPT